MGKAVYSYEYMDSWEKFKERKQPPKNVFLQQPEYGVGKCYLRRLLWYLSINIYCTIGWLFETFQNMCLGHYKLDTAHFYTTPGLAWQALIKIASKYWHCKDCELCLDKKIRFELLRDIDILLILEKHLGWYYWSSEMLCQCQP